jgi:hypothetical protein
MKSVSNKNSFATNFQVDKILMPYPNRFNIIAHKVKTLKVRKAFERFFEK